MYEHNNTHASMSYASVSATKAAYAACLAVLSQCTLSEWYRTTATTVTEQATPALALRHRTCVSTLYQHLIAVTLFSLCCVQVLCQGADKQLMLEAYCNRVMSFSVIDYHYEVRQLHL
jgi:hypothetical protein